MKLCRNGLHDKDLPGGQRASGRCNPCRRATEARYDQSPKGRQKVARYDQSPKGRACTARHQRARRLRLAAEWLRSRPRSYLDGCFSRQSTRIERLQQMAEQTTSPVEAAIARQKLELYVG